MNGVFYKNKTTNRTILGKSKKNQKQSMKFLNLKTKKRWEEILANETENKERSDW